MKGVLDPSVLDLLVAAADPDGGLPADPTGRRWSPGGPPGRILLLGAIPHVRTHGWLHTRFDYRDGSVVGSTVMFRQVIPVGSDAMPSADALLWREPIRPGTDGWPSHKVLLDGRGDSALRPDPTVRDAYGAARAARFEYGESGAPARELFAPSKPAVSLSPGIPEQSADRLFTPAPSVTPRSTGKTRGPRRKTPKPIRSGREFFEQIWPGVKASVAESDPLVGEVLSRAKVAEVRKRTVVLMFAADVDRESASAANEALCGALHAAAGIGPWAVRYVGEDWVPEPEPVYDTILFASPSRSA